MRKATQSEMWHYIPWKYYHFITPLFKELGKAAALVKMNKRKKGWRNEGAANNSQKKRLLTKKLS